MKTEKRCPFCHGPAVLEATEGEAFLFFRCYWCSARGPYRKTTEEARVAWNKRSRDIPQRVRYFIHKNFTNFVWRLKGKP